MRAGTVLPEQLADSDSKFVEVDGVRIHYKERVADPDPGPAPAAAAAVAFDLAFSPSATGGVEAGTADGAGGDGRGASSGSSSNGRGAEHAAAEAVTAMAGAGMQEERFGEPGPQRPTLLLMHGLNGSTFSW